MTLKAYSKNVRTLTAPPALFQCNRFVFPAFRAYSKVVERNGYSVETAETRTLRHRMGASNKTMSARSLECVFLVAQSVQGQRGFSF